MRQKSIDLIVTTIIAALNVTLALFPIHVSTLKIIFALPLLFVLPGYTLSDVLFHKRSLNASERLLFTLGLSLAIDMLGGLFLNLLPTGLQATSWAIFLGSLTLILSFLAAYLRKGVPMTTVGPLRVHLTIYSSILFILAIAVTTTSIVYASYGASRQSYPGFTQLWLLPEVPTGKSCAVRVGVQSFEPASGTYRLTVTSNGDLVAAWPSLSLAPQEKWERLVTVPPSASNDISVDVRLYQQLKPETIYRQTHLTLSNVTEGKEGKTRQCGTPPTTPTES